MKGSLKKYFESWDKPLFEEFDPSDYTKAEVAKYKEAIIEFVRDIIKKVYDAKMAGISNEYLAVYSRLASDQLEDLDKIDPKESDALRKEYTKMLKKADIDKKKKQKNPFNISKEMMKEWNSKIKAAEEAEKKRNKKSPL